MMRTHADGHRVRVYYPSAHPCQGTDQDAVLSHVLPTAIGGSSPWTAVAWDPGTPGPTPMMFESPTPMCFLERGPHTDGGASVLKSEAAAAGCGPAGYCDYKPWPCKVGWIKQGLVHRSSPSFQLQAPSPTPVAHLHTRKPAHPHLYTRRHVQLQAHCPRTRRHTPQHCIRCTSSCRRRRHTR
ncbi:hypothetical protein C2E23DRAFT_268250 [Lenzites betulinus]|nr:hypothetical protein C2E23DRAFT_268250 [Lenzites betulinus]